MLEAGKKRFKQGPDQAEVVDRVHNPQHSEEASEGNPTAGSERRDSAWEVDSPSDHPGLDLYYVSYDLGEWHLILPCGVMGL
jgi:hypothetical protein